MHLTHLKMAMMEKSSFACTEERAQGGGSWVGRAWRKSLRSRDLKAQPSKEAGFAQRYLGGGISLAAVPYGGPVDDDR